MNVTGPPLVVALGGNAILRKGERGLVREQYTNIERTCRDLLPLLKADYPLLFTHGNGPQIGNLMLSLEATRDQFPLLPMDVCGAMTQGSIGYMLQRTLANFLNNAGIHRPVVTVVTQVVVDPRDDAFWKPTKPVGPYYAAEQAAALQRDSGWTMAEDAGRGYRRVVASPNPVEIVERHMIRTLALSGAVVICAGGGGIPVIRSGDGTLVPIEGVIDKDLASARLALDVGAHRLLILTSVEQVAVHWGRPDQQAVSRATASEMRAWMEEKQFPEGSMGPKVQAALDFLAGGGHEVVITLPETAAAALAGRTGTRLTP
ncbi:MAG TPA: carbamate kinase [Candidatus Methylomirabilis sp.]